MASQRLELYVVGSHGGTAAAREAAQRLSSRRTPALELAVFDLAHSPLAAQQAGVLLAPTLILRTDSGERRCFGDLSDTDSIGAALGLATS